MCSGGGWLGDGEKTVGALQGAPLRPVCARHACLLLAFSTAHRLLHNQAWFRSPLPVLLHDVWHLSADAAAAEQRRHRLHERQAVLQVHSAVAALGSVW